jgi:hypothetical protein
MEQLPPNPAVLVGLLAGLGAGAVLILLVAVFRPRRGPDRAAWDVGYAPEVYPGPPPDQRVGDEAGASERPPGAGDETAAGATAERAPEEDDPQSRGPRS